ncbi:MAG TPA: OmpA family protein [Methylibium sp.]|uniref:OmpA family protein n=1 Tax=Methylibium sp. TaxID=2067992 RepID=UPI002DBBE45D|nr:OmpA family protein [Methylibium sp.]HEU4459342.1 OmpA family protein [Methylibium sp.]
MRLDASAARGGAALSLALAALGVSAQGGANAPVEPVSVRAVANFDFDDATVRGEDRDKLLAEVGKLKDVTWQTVRATGHTDSVGAADYNERLSERRAEAVKSYLVGKGLLPETIRTEGQSELRPVAPNDSAAGRAKNRRTEVEFIGVRSAKR